MDFRLVKYFLIHKDARVFLFESQFQFSTEQDCLRNYEKGILNGLFKFNRSQVDQIWCDLKLWGILGRRSPVELIKVLCAFGCSIESFNFEAGVLKLNKSFKSVTYFVSIAEKKRMHFRYIFQEEQDIQEDVHVPFMLDFGDKLIIGAHYFTDESGIDLQFPAFCKLLDQDLCLRAASFQKMLNELFYEGYKINADIESGKKVLAEIDLIENIIRGFENEETLFYVAVEQAE